MSKWQKIKLWLPVIVWAGVIFSFSSLGINKVKDFSWVDFVIKKTAHVTEYAILYLLTFRAVSQKGRLIGKKQFILPLIIAMFYGLTDEWHQTFVPQREGTLRDVGFDSLGALISMYWMKRNI